MVDTLFKHREHAVGLRPWAEFNVDPGEYALLTLHRPSNVDDEENFSRLSTVINDISERLPIIFPVHPRTAKQISSSGISFNKKVLVCEPLSYLSFLGLMSKSLVVITDSGGIQEETTALGVPCLTLRANTERPSTIDMGTNRLIDPCGNGVHDALEEILTDKWQKGCLPPLWDGHAAGRLCEIIVDALKIPQAIRVGNLQKKIQTFRRKDYYEGKLSA